MAWGAQALLLNEQVVGSWILDNPKQWKYKDWGLVLCQTLATQLNFNFEEHSKLNIFAIKNF